MIRRNSGRQIRKDNLLRFHNVVSKPEVLYGSKFWTMSEAED
jgi:hypothetical protein